MFNSEKEKKQTVPFPVFSAFPWALFLHFYMFSAQRAGVGGRGLTDGL